MTGTAAEVTPVRQVDHMTIGNGGCGPLTRRLQDAFFGLFRGRRRTAGAGWNQFRRLRPFRAASDKKRQPG